MTREEIRAQFESGQITWSDALDLLKKAQPPWRTKKWDLRRQEVIGDACGVCGNQDPPLVLQHKWHPAPFSNLCERVKPALRDEYEKTHPFIPPVIRPFDPSTVPPPDMVERDSCPKCASIAVKYRSTLQNWICNGKQRYRTCGHIFLEPVKRMWSRKTHEELIESARHAHERQAEYAELEWERGFITAYYERICHEATRLSFIEHDRYMEMRAEDVMTCCKRCAFIQDIAYAKYSRDTGYYIETARRLSEEQSDQ
jgi:hypothetical protein